jgi:hypothetical protein
VWVSCHSTACHVVVCLYCLGCHSIYMHTGIEFIHFRLQTSITSPAYIDSYRTTGSNDNSETVKTIANEALTKMLALDKCECTKINPLFGSDLVYKPRASTYVYQAISFYCAKICFVHTTWSLRTKASLIGIHILYKMIIKESGSANAFSISLIA